MKTPHLVSPEIARSLLGPVWSEALARVEVADNHRLVLVPKTWETLLAGVLAEDHLRERINAACGPEIHIRGLLWAPAVESLP